MSTRHRPPPARVGRYRVATKAEHAAVCDIRSHNLVAQNVPSKEVWLCLARDCPQPVYGTTGWGEIESEYLDSVARGAAFGQRIPTHLHPLDTLL
jgi:hypothetical protein